MNKTFATAAATALMLAFAPPAFAEGVSAAVANQVATSPASTDAATPATFTLTVTVTGVRSARGMIMAGLLKADPVAGTASTVGGSRATAVEGVTILTFTGLTEGDYAVRLFHDENGDGQMSTNLFGIPTEGFGFSNGARAGFGPPDFSDMKVEVRADATTNAVMAY